MNLAPFITVCLLIVAAVAANASDQHWWTKIQRILCADDSGHPIQVSEEKLKQLVEKCEIKKKEGGPLSSCADNPFETERDLLNAFCDPKIFACVAKKPLLSAEEMLWDQKPDELKQELVNCIANVIKYDYYMFDETINFI